MRCRVWPLLPMAPAAALFSGWAAGAGTQAPPDRVPEVRAALAQPARSVSPKDPRRGPARSAPADGSRPELVLQVEHFGFVNAVAFSPDGMLLASGGEDGLRLWDVDPLRGYPTGEVRWRPAGAADAVLALAFSPDGKLLASAGPRAVVNLWDARTGSKTRTLDAYSGLPNSVAFSSGTRATPTLLAVAHDAKDGSRTVQLWNPRAGRMVRALRSATAPVAFSPDGRILATGGAGNLVKLWDAATGKLRRVLKGHSMRVASVAFSPDGRTVASGAGYQLAGELKLWEAATGKLRGDLKENRENSTIVNSVAFSPDGRTLVCGTGEADAPAEAIAWDVATRKRKWRWENNYGNPVSSVAFAPGGGTVAAASWDSSVTLLNARTGSPRRTLALHYGWLWGWGEVHSTDGKAAVTKGMKGLQLWDLEGLALRWTQRWPDSFVSVAISPDGRRAAASGADGVRIWDARAGTLERTLPTRSVESVLFSPDGRTVAVKSSVGGRGPDHPVEVTLWDAETGKAGTSLKAADPLSFSPDGRTLASGAPGGTVQLWDIATGRLRQSLMGGPSETIAGIAFSGNGDRLAAGCDRTGGGAGASIRIWRGPPDSRGGSPGEPGGGLWVPDRVLAAGTSSLQALVFSPDGTMLAIAGLSGGVEVWGTRTGRKQQRLWTGAPLAFAAEGRTLVTGAVEEPGFSWWDLETGRLLATLRILPPDRVDEPPTDWIAFTPEGYFTGSPGAKRFIRWRAAGDTRAPLLPAEAHETAYHRPDQVRKALRGAQETEEHGAAAADALDDAVRATMREHGVVGVSLAIVQDGKIVRARGYGVRDRESGEPVTATTLFQAGSVSKPVAAAAVLGLVEQRRLDLDADVNLYLKGWKVPESALARRSKVTLRRLLSHSAGMTVSGFPGYARGDPVPTLRQVLDGAKPANTAPVRVNPLPGSQWSYSGGGYTVVQQMVLDVTGEGFPSFMRRAVLGPLGMSRSTYGQPLTAGLARDAATGYYEGPRPVPGRWHVYPEMAAAGLWTTPSDPARFLIAVQDAWAGRSRKPVSQRTARLMVTPVLNNNGLGLFAEGRGKSLRFGHGGRNEGFDTWMKGYLSSRQGAVIMFNTNASGPVGNEIAGAISAMYNWPR